VTDQREHLPALLEEIRFAKTRMTFFGGSALALIGTIFGVARTVELDATEKLGIISVFGIIASIGAALVYKQHRHLRNTRLLLDPNDIDAWKRGAEIVRALALTIFVCAAGASYYLWHYHPMN
jgi:hypothetical protein